jgi:hypothetical protein
LNQLRYIISFFFLLSALDPFKTLPNENNLLNLTEGNIAVISCELPNGNPKPIPIFTLDNNRLDIDPKSSIRELNSLKKDNQSFLFLS